MFWFQFKSVTCFHLEQLDDVTGSCVDVFPVFQIMDIINENEAQFLSSLRQGSWLIQRTLSRKDCRDQLFPGQRVLVQSSGLMVGA